MRAANAEYREALAEARESTAAEAFSNGTLNYFLTCCRSTPRRIQGLPRCFTCQQHAIVPNVVYLKINGCFDKPKHETRGDDIHPQRVLLRFHLVFASRGHALGQRLPQLTPLPRAVLRQRHTSNDSRSRARLLHPSFALLRKSRPSRNMTA